jgi:4-amino-4-deoxy-L-arabinose transferase-like glycosyltransferase
MTRSEPAGWLAPAVLLIAALTAVRLALLTLDRTDLFVDESQYWLWGQSFAFGYYSKPPLIAWVIGAVTTLSGSDDPFWIRAPGAVFHGATALILGAMAARLYGNRAGVWAAVTYATLPMVSLGSLLISTDTIMAPFFAAALYFHTRLIGSPALRHALLAGAMAGLAFLAKYAAVYFLLGAGLGALLIPALRLTPFHAAALVAAFTCVVLPNLLWNATHGMATASHILDNIGWVRNEAPLSGLNPTGLVEFFLAQFAVFGPILFAALLWAAATLRLPRLLVFALPALALVCVQALLDRAYANWAAAAYFAGTVLVVALLLSRPRLLALSLVVNGAIAFALPVATLFPEATFGGDAPLLKRYLGREAVSRQIIAAAQEAGGVPIVAERRDILADLFYSGRDAGLAIYAPRPEGRPQDHYAQTYAVPPDLTGPILFVGEAAPDCPGLPPGQPLTTAGGGYEGLSLSAWLIDADCLK